MHDARKPAAVRKASAPPPMAPPRAPDPVIPRPAAKLTARDNGAGSRQAPGPIAELRVSAHLMSLDTGTFCVFHAPGSPVAAEPGNGLPAVRLSLPPGAPPGQKSDAVCIRTLNDDGWLTGAGAAALIRVADGPAQILVTIYQAPGQTADNAPRLQVLRLGPDRQPTKAVSLVPADAEVVAHVQTTGDVGVRLGEWLGVAGSGHWIEGFAVIPPAPLGTQGIEYQAVLGRGWNSPWVMGGQFCGSRGMALPLLGLRLRLKGELASRYELTCSASFVDGSRAGPVGADEACECESLAPLEAFRIVLTARPAWLVPRKARGSAPMLPK